MSWDSLERCAGGSLVRMKVPAMAAVNVQTKVASAKVMAGTRGVRPH